MFDGMNYATIGNEELKNTKGLTVVVEMSEELESELDKVKHKIKSVMLENHLLKSKVYILEQNKQLLESRIGQLSVSKAGVEESIEILLQRIGLLEEEKHELEQALSEIYDG